MSTLERIFCWDIDFDVSRRVTLPNPRWRGPFLAAADVPLEARAGASMTLDFGGRQLRLPRDGADEGIIIAVYD